MVKRLLTRIAYALGPRALPYPNGERAPRFWPHPCYHWPALDTLEPPPSAALLSAKEAKERLRKIVAEFFFRRGRQGETAARHLLVRSPPGLGKTKEAMAWATRYQAEQDAAPLLEICLDDVTEGGAIAQTAVFVPRHALALEIKEVIESNLAARGLNPRMTLGLREI